MADSTVNIVHELTFVANESSVQKVDQTIANLTRSLQAITQNTRQAGTNLTNLAKGFQSSSKAANDYSNSMKRAAEATAKFGQVSQQTGNASNAAIAKITAAQAKLNASLQRMITIALAASQQQVNALNNQATAAQQAAAAVNALGGAYNNLHPPGGATGGGGSSSGGSTGSPNDDSRIFGVKLSAIQRRFVTGYIVGAGFSAFNATLNTIKEFVSDSSRLASEMEGITKAFERLGDPDLLKRLREATGGTVSDLDLMQRSVNAVNLGLPVEQLAKAFEFARIRARETGQSVDYLVNSVVLGIGRKSPLILDNLGINALRVRERFKEIGSFSKAAFEIINEEIAKSGGYVDQFADRMDQLTAAIKNQETEFGKLVNTAKDYGAAILLDVTNLFKLRTIAPDEAATKPVFEKTNIEKLAEIREAAEENAKRTTEANELAARRYAEFYNDFEKGLVTADAAARDEIIKQAAEMYEKLKQKAYDFAKSTGLDVSVLLKSLDDMNQKFNRFKDQTTPDISQLTVGRLRQKPLSRQELVDTQTAIALERGLLDITDTKRIAQLDAVDDEVTRQLKIIDGKTKAAKAARTLASEELNLARQIAKVREDITQESLEREANSYTKLEELHKAELRRGTETLDALEADLIRRKIINDKATGEAKRISDKNKALLKELRDLTTQLTGIKFTNAQAALLDQQRDALNRAFRSRVSAAAELRAEYVSEGDVSSIAKIRKQVELERRAEVAEEQARHEDELRALRDADGYNNKAIEAEEDAHYLRMENIRLKYQHKEINSIKTHFDQIRVELQRQYSLEAAQIQAIITGEQEDLNETEGGLFFDRGHRQRLIGARARVRKAGLAVKQTAGEVRNAEIEEAIARGEVATKGDDPGRIRAAQDAYVRLTEARAKSAEAGKEQRDADNDWAQALYENVPKIADLYNEMSSTVVNAYNMISQAQQEQLNREIDIRQQRLILAEKFAERGNTTYLRQEQQRLDQSYKQQAAAARQQIAINTALAASQAAVGVVKAAATGAEGGPYLIIANVLAFIAAIAAGFVAATNAANNAQPSVQFFTGGYTGDGGKYQEAGTVHKGEFVSNQETTRRHRRVLESMHDGTFDDKYARVDEKALMLSDGRPAKDKDTLKKLDQVIEAVEGNKVSVRQSLDRNGLLQVVEHTLKTDRQRFS